MTDQKLQQLAREYAEEQINGMDFVNEYERTCELDHYRCAFLAGAAYALGNQWRDAGKEKPEDEQVVLILTTYIGANSGEPRTLIEQYTYFEQYGFWLKEKSERHLKLKVHAWMEIPQYKPKEKI